MLFRKVIRVSLNYHKQKVDSKCFPLACLCRYVCVCMSKNVCMFDVETKVVDLGLQVTLRGRSSSQKVEHAFPRNSLHLIWIKWMPKVSVADLDLDWPKAFLPVLLWFLQSNVSKTLIQLHDKSQTVWGLGKITHARWVVRPNVKPRVLNPS